MQNNKTTTNQTSPHNFIDGVVDIFPMLLGTAPFGIIFGAYALEMGIGIGGGQGFSLFVFAGSAQFVGANLYGQGASLVVIAITTFFINLRHTLYGASLGPKFSNLKPETWQIFYKINGHNKTVCSRNK